MFPRFRLWDDPAGQSDNGEFIDYINRKLNPLGIFLSDSDVREALRDLKTSIRSGEYGHSFEDELVSMLKSKLIKDRQLGGGQGLYRSRSRFLVFCYVAERIRSRELAKALLRFFEKEGDDIVDGDESHLLAEWCLGLRQLQNLVAEEKLRKAFHPVAGRGPPLFEEWRRPGPHHSWIPDISRYLHDEIVPDNSRARDRLQLLAPHHLHARRLSVPMYRRPSFEVASYPRTGYNSPLMAPRNDLHALRLYQQLQGLELARLQRDVDDLQRHRY